MIMRKQFLTVVSLIFFYCLNAEAKPIEVVASFTVIADMVGRIGGDRIVVSSLVGPNGDPHAFEPSPDDARRLSRADIVFVNGLGLEGWIDRLIAASGFKGAIAVVTKDIPTRMTTENGKDIVDPHEWNSAPNAIFYVRNIVTALSTVDPGGAEQFNANGDRYIEELKELDNYARQKINEAPKDRRKILTSHDSFGYFGDTYGVEFLSPIGMSTESEASAGDIARLIDQIRREHIAIYFLENSNDPKLIQQIAHATKAQLGGKLVVEALTDPKGPAPTYIEMFRHNVDLLVAAMKQN